MSTIVDVARKAGVSVATVSRVLNGKSAVSADLRERVTKAMALLDYMPNPTARNLRKSETRTILILAPNLTNPYYTHIIAGIGESAHEHGYSSFLCDTQSSRQRQEELLSRLELHQADGAIVMASEMGCSWLGEYAKKYPIVQTSEFDPDVDVAHVSIDNYKAARDVMDYLLGLEHTRIGFIGSVNKYYSTAMRRKGYTDALSEAGIAFNEDYVRSAAYDYTFESGFECARSLLSQETRPTALFCISDMLALGAIAGAHEMGFRVPEDVTVIGFNDVDHTTMFHPYVTAVVQPCFEIGRRAMDMLYDLMHSLEVPPEIILPHRLAIRESSARRHYGFTDFAVRFGADR